MGDNISTNSIGAIYQCMDKRSLGRCGSTPRYLKVKGLRPKAVRVNAMKAEWGKAVRMEHKAIGLSERPEESLVFLLSIGTFQASCLGGLDNRFDGGNKGENSGKN